MTTKANFKVIKATSPAFNGARYLAHLPNVGFAFISALDMQECNFERIVLKFNSNLAYDVASMGRMLDSKAKEFPQHTLRAIDMADIGANL